MRQVEDALARQTLYGGDVVTNLLEVAPPRDRRGRAHGRARRVAGAPGRADRGAARAGSAVVARVPRNLAEHHGFVPIAIRDGAIVVALAEPLTRRVARRARDGARRSRSCRRPRRSFDCIRRSSVRTACRWIGARVGSRRSSTVRIHSSRLSRRTSAIPDVARRSRAGRAQATTSRAGARGRDAPTPTPSVTASRPPPPTTIRTPNPGVDALKWFVKSARSDRSDHPDRDDKRRESAPRFSLPGSPGGRRRRGPFTRDDVEKVFAEAESTDAVLGARSSSRSSGSRTSRCSSCTTISPRGGRRRGRAPRAIGCARWACRSIFRACSPTARETRVPIVRRRPTDGLDGVIAADLERPLEGDVLVAPIVVGKRVVALLYADDAGEAIDSGEVADVVSAVANAGAALARMILKKKGKSAPVAAKLFTPPQPRERRSDPESLAERAHVLARALISEPPRAPSERVRTASLEPIVAPLPQEEATALRRPQGHVADDARCQVGAAGILARFPDRSRAPRRIGLGRCAARSRAGDRDAGHEPADAGRRRPRLRADAARADALGRPCTALRADRRVGDAAAAAPLRSPPPRSGDPARGSRQRT